MGISLLRNFQDNIPDEKAVQSSYQLIEYIEQIIIEALNDTSGFQFQFITHRDAPGSVPTACPGANLYSIWKDHEYFVSKTDDCN